MNEIPLNEHERIVREGKDIPEQQPSVPIRLNRVGITGNRIWINLPEGRLPFDSSISVSLSGHRRGIHMSRIEDTIAWSFDQEFGDLKEFAKKFCHKIMEGQKSNGVFLKIKGSLPRTETTPISEKRSIEALEIFLTAQGSGTEITMEIGIEIEHITACPCTQAYHQTWIGETAQHPLPLPTHSQKTVTRISIQDLMDRLYFWDILKPAASSLHLIQGLLKRPDEAELVIRAHRRPQFVEDVVRELAAATVRELGDRIDPEAFINIESLSLESIHTHNVQAEFSARFQEIRDLVENS